MIVCMCVCVCIIYHVCILIYIRQLDTRDYLPLQRSKAAGYQGIRVLATGARAMWGYFTQMPCRRYNYTQPRIWRATIECILLARKETTYSKKSTTYRQREGSILTGPWSYFTDSGTSESITLILQVPKRMLGAMATGNWACAVPRASYRYPQLHTMI